MYGAGASRKVEANGDESCVGGVASGSRGTRLLGRLGAIDMDCGTQGARSPVYNRSKELA
jgi:hypothetical protein